MRTSLSLPTLRVILAGSFVLVLAAACANWTADGVTTGWALSGALLALAATASWVLYRHAVAVNSQRAQLEGHEARWQEISIAQQRFIDNLAHDLRTPLSIVLSEAELIFACSDDPAVVKDNARSIADYVLHLSALCDGFLRLEGPLVKSDTSGHVPVHIHEAVLEAVGRSQATARGRGVSVVTTLAESGDDDAALEVRGNPVLLAAMIENVVRNAVRATPRDTHVELQVAVRGESIVLQVRDHGAGISPAQLASAFDWVCQAPDGPRQAKGPGVGLAIAQRIARHHRGTISLQNHSEGGCEFEISLPRLRVAGQLLERPAALVPDSAARPA